MYFEVHLITRTKAFPLLLLNLQRMAGKKDWLEQKRTANNDNHPCDKRISAPKRDPRQCLAAIQCHPTSNSPLNPLLHSRPFA
jgi:hypothetical protein